jgi:hypothetical protein
MALRKRLLIPSVTVVANVRDVTPDVSGLAAESALREPLAHHVRSELPVRTHRLRMLR